MMDDKKSSPRVKPALPPKPKILAKPNLPPKPPQVISKQTSPKVQKIDRINSTTEDGQNMNYVSSLISSFESKMPAVKLDDVRTSKNLSNSGTSLDNSKNLESLTVNSDYNSEHTNDSNRNSLYGTTYSNGGFSIDSTSTTSSDDVSRLHVDDFLDKLSDGYGSDRSTSPSPYSPCMPLSPTLNNDSHFSVDFNNTNTCNNAEYENKSDKVKKKIHNIAQEMMTSEKVFCNVLKLLNDDFRKHITEQGCVSSNIPNGTFSRNSQNITEEELNRILNYLPQLQNFSEGFLQDMQERLTDWAQHNKIADIIVQKGPFLKMYSSYIRDFEHQCTLLDEACSKHQSFAKALKEFECSDICCKLSLKHYMLKPVQRIPQYRLLLQSYLELLSDDHPDVDDARKALLILQEVANHANDTIKIEDKVSELLALQRRLYKPDGGQPELIRPGRELLKKGELMKLCRRGMQPRYFVLLSDALLYTSYSTSSNHALLRLNTELPLEGMRVSKPNADDFKAELTVRATQRSFTLQARTETERDEWLSSIQAAIDANILRRSSFLAASTAAYSAPNNYDLGKQAPVWVPDYRVSMCQVCTTEFSLTFRRHHCRACGKVVCDSCSSNRAPLEYKNNQPERVCDQCYETLFEALQEKIKTSTPPHKEKEQEEERVEETEPDYVEETGDRFSRKVMTIHELKKLKVSFKKGIRDSMRGKSCRKPDRLLEVSANDSGSQMKGYLRRNGGRRGSPRLGWFVLKERVLYQYAAPEDVCALESLPVLGYTLNSENVDKGVDLSFTLKHPNQEDIVFTVETEELALKWVSAMKGATVL